MALLTLSEGNSLITETVFENRLRHVAELNRMGQTFASGNNAIVRVPICGRAPVVATDLRASAALVLAALAAKGKTTIHGLHHLIATINWRRSYFLGARLQRVPNSAADTDSRSSISNPVSVHQRD